MGGPDEQWWSNTWKISPDQWMDNIGANPGIGLEQMLGYQDNYMAHFETRTGLRNWKFVPGPAPKHPIESVELPDCTTVDCVALAIDSAGVAGSSLAAASPLCGPAFETCAGAGLLIGRLATGAGAIYTGYNYLVQGSASDADILVAATTTSFGLGSRSYKVGLAASIVQFIWDIFVSPNDQWE
jgi:hypothetical protein